MRVVTTETHHLILLQLIDNQAGYELVEIKSKI